MSNFGDLPQELIDKILGYLDNDRQALAKIRLVWPSLDPNILPRLFSVIRLSFLERHRLQFLGISSSPHLAPHVRILRWYSSHHNGEYPDSVGFHQVQAFLYSDAIPKFRPLFLEGLDAMVNLRTITTVIMHPSQSRGALWHEDLALRKVTDRYFSRLDLIHGFDNFLVPAMLSYESKVESLRLLCKSMALEDLDTESSSPREESPEEEFRHDTTTYDRALIEVFRSLRVRLDSFALRNVKELDICSVFPSSVNWEFQRRELHSQLSDIISSAKGIQILCLRDADAKTEREPNSRCSTTFPGLHSLLFEHLNTLKLVNLVFSVTEFNALLAKHAEILQHVLLYNCAGTDAGLIDVVRFAASDPLIHLHRFAVYIPETIGLGPWKGFQTTAAQIIPEQEIVDFINSNEAKNMMMPVSRKGVEHAAEDPFLHRQPIDSDDWHSANRRQYPANASLVDHYTNLWATAVESPESLRSEWPQWRTLHYSCKACRRLSDFE